MTTFCKIGPEEAARLSEIASRVVKAHFDPLIGPAQNDYMIEKFQSEPAIRAPLAGGYRYYWVMEEGETAGFLAFYPREGKLYLSKFYLLEGFRGRGLAGKMFAFVAESARAEGLSAVYLNVNRGNTGVIRVYEHLGFQIVREEKNDIGGGFFMDDYVMECPLT